MAINVNIEGIGDISIETGPMEAVFNDMTKALKDLKKEIHESDKIKKKQHKEAEDLEKEKNESTEEATKQNSKLAHGAGYAAGVIVGLAEKTVSLISDFSTLGNSLTGATAMFNGIPVLGPMLSSVASASVTVVDNFNTLTQSGATFNGSALAMTRAAGRAGMSLDEFAGFVQSNSDALRFLGGTTEQGAQRFGDLSKEVRNTNRDLHGLGFSTRDLNDGILGYTRQLGLQGRIEGATRQDLIQGTRRYMLELDRIAKVTGQTRKEVEAQRQQLLVDAQFQAATIALEDKARESFVNTVQGLAPGLQNFAKDIIAVGVATTEENQKLMALLPESAAMLTDFHQKIQRGEEVSLEERNRINNLIATEGRNNLEQIRQAAAASPELAALVNSLMSGIQMQTDVMKESTENQLAALAAQEALNKTVNTARENISELSNELMRFLAEEAVVEQLQKVFENLLDFVRDPFLPFLEDTLMPVLTATTKGLAWVSDNLILTGIVLIGFKATSIVFNAAITSMATSAGRAALGLWALATPFAKLGLVIAGVALVIAGIMTIFNRNSKKAAAEAEANLKDKTTVDNRLIDETKNAAERISKVGMQGSVLDPIRIANILYSSPGAIQQQQTPGIAAQQIIDQEKLSQKEQQLEDLKNQRSSLPQLDLSGAGEANNAAIIRQNRQLNEEISQLKEAINDLTESLKENSDVTSANTSNLIGI